MRRGRTPFQPEDIYKDFASVSRLRTCADTAVDITGIQDSVHPRRGVEFQTVSVTGLVGLDWRVQLEDHLKDWTCIGQSC